MVAEQNKFKSFPERVLSGAILVVFLIALLLSGGDLLLIFSVVLSIIGVIEITKVLALSKSLTLIIFPFTIFYYVIVVKYAREAILLFLISMILLLLMFYVFSYPKYSIKDIALTIFTIFYVPVMFSFVYLLREQRGEFGKYLVWLIFISSWGCDTFAYFTGLLLGKHKLIEQVSPHKTIEGSIGGVLGSIVLGIIYVFVLNYFIKIDINMSIIRVSITCALSAIFSQIGDFTASAIKREYNIKDYGNLIPGHGGVLDRFDSVIFTAPIIYFMFHIAV